MLAEAIPPVWLNEMLDFLAGGPTPEQIIAFKLSPATQARLEELLDKNREAELTNEETAELDVYKQITLPMSHFPKVCRSGRQAT